MASLYPAQIDTPITLPTVSDNITSFKAVYINQLRDAITYIEAALGTNPGGVYGTVANAIESINVTINNAISLGGDIGGFPNEPIVIGLQGRPIATNTPDTGQVLTWTGSEWAPVNPGELAEEFVVTVQGTPFLEFGQALINPIFTATYSNFIFTGFIQDNQFNPPQNIFSSPAEGSPPVVPPNTFVYNQSYEYSSPHSIIFSLTAFDGTLTTVTPFTTTWSQRLYYGTAGAGGNSGSFIQSLPYNPITNNPVTSLQGFTFTVNAGDGEAIYFAYRSAYGTADFWVNGFEGGFNLVSTTISVTNAFGYTEDYTLYQSNQVGLGITTINVFYSGTTELTSLDTYSAETNLGGTSALHNVFVYAEGGVAANNVYSSFAEAYAARQTIQGQAIIEIDDSNSVGNAVINAGSYNLDDTILVGKLDSLESFATNITLTIQNGVTLNNLRQVFNLRIVQDGTSPAMVYTGGVEQSLLLQQTILSSNDAPLISVVDGSSLVIAGYTCNISAGGFSTQPVIQVENSSIVVILAFNASTLDFNSIVGDSSSTVEAVNDGTGNLNSGQAGFAGTLTLGSEANSNWVNYNPSTPSDWSPVPAYVNTALDQLAEYTSVGVTGQVATIAQLRTTNPALVPATINLQGYTAAGDGGGGLFYWNSTSTTADNGGTIIAVTGITTGRWIRIYSGAIDIRWFGAVCDDTIAYDTSAINAAIAWATTVGGGEILIPQKSPSTFTGIQGTVNAISNITIRGISAESKSRVRHTPLTANEIAFAFVPNPQGGGNLISAISIKNLIINTPNAIATTSIYIQDAVYFEVSDMLIGGANLDERNVAIHLSQQNATVPSMGFGRIYNIATTSLEATHGWVGDSSVGILLDAAAGLGVLTGSSLCEFSGYGDIEGRGSPFVAKSCYGIRMKGWSIAAGPASGPTDGYAIEPGVAIYLNACQQCQFLGCNIINGSGTIPALVIDGYCFETLFDCPEFVSFASPALTVPEMVVDNGTNTIWRGTGSDAIGHLQNSRVTSGNLPTPYFIPGGQTWTTDGYQPLWSDGTNWRNLNVTYPIKAFIDGAITLPGGGGAAVESTSSTLDGITIGTPFTGSIQRRTDNTGLSVLYLGPNLTPSSTNFTVQGDGTNTIINAGSSGGSIYMTMGNNFDNPYPLILTSSSMTLGVPSFTFDVSETNPTINQVATSSASGATLTIQAQNATGASHNGGNLILAGGTSGSATVGSVELQANSVTVASIVANKFVTNLGRRRHITSTTISYLVLATDDIIAVGTTSAGITVTLPASPTAGDAFDVKDTVGLAATNNITISGNGNDIDGASTFVISTNYGSVTLVFNGSEWNIL
jgi:hypothetical protein